MEQPRKYGFYWVKMINKIWWNTGPILICLKWNKNYTPSKPEIRTLFGGKSYSIEDVTEWIEQVKPPTGYRYSLEPGFLLEWKE